jgi:hypothetical protein
VEKGEGPSSRARQGRAPRCGAASGEFALQDSEDNGKSEVMKVLCHHGARRALCCAAKNDLADMMTELISKDHDLEECYRVLVYEL